VSRLKTTLLAGVMACSLLALSACGDSDDGGSNASGGEISASALAQAKENLAPYTGQPGAFPVDEPLAKKPPAGTTIAFLQCSTPVCAVQAELFAIPTKTLLGNDLIVVKAGPSAQELQQAMDSIIAKKPSAVILPAVDPSQFRPQMEELDRLGIPVVTTGVIDMESFPAIKAGLLGPKASERAGKLFADWAVVRNGTAPSVFYTIPELSFSPIMFKAYQDEMKQLCPSCEVREVKIPIATVGNTAPQTVVNDLRSHPETKTAVFASAEAMTGLPAALKVAGLSPDTVGFAPSPTVLGYIQKGEVTAGLPVDSLVTEFSGVDMVARVLTGQELTKAEADDELAMQMVTKEDLEGKDLSKGFAAYPDVVERMTKLWNGQ